MPGLNKNHPLSFKMTGDFFAHRGALARSIIFVHQRWSDIERFTLVIWNGSVVRDMPSSMALKDTKQPQNKGGEEDGEGGEDRGKDEDLTRELGVALAAPSGRELSP